VGETASTGVHGANRLASNSLLECLVFGAQFGDNSKFKIPFGSSTQGREQNSKFNVQNSESKIQNPKSKISPSLEELAYIEKLRQNLPRLVWQSAGICREASQMKGAIAQVEQWQEEFAHLPLSQALQKLAPGEFLSLQVGAEGRSLRPWAETRNLLTVALLILKSADFRTESRGGHFRSDYPQPDPAWQVHTLVQLDTQAKAPRLWKGAIDL
jgi:L-aspartate oxidase